jgi:hypothetical protein
MWLDETVKNEPPKSSHAAIERVIATRERLRAETAMADKFISDSSTDM